MAANIVEIIVTGKNLATPVFAKAEAEAGALRSSFLKVGAGFAIAAGVVAVESAKMATKFDADMTRINTQAAVSKDKIKGLSDGLLDMAGSVGEGPDKLADSLFHVESAFESTGIASEKALKMVETAAKGARVGNADLVSVTNALTAAVAANIPGVQNLDQAMGVLNATVGVGDMKMQDLADAFGTGMVAVVKGYGLSITDVGAALAVFGDNNIRGAQAGTQLRMAVQAMAVPVKGAKDALDRLGLTNKTLAKDMQHGGLNEAVTDLKTRMDAAGISSKQQGAIITEMFGKRAGTGVNILIGQFDRLQSKYPELKKGANNFGDAWSETSKTTSQKLADLKGAFDALMIRIGEKLTPTIGKLADALSGVVGFISDNIDILGPLAAAIAIVASAMVTWALATKLVDAAMLLLDANPVVLIAVAVAAAALLIITHWNEIKDALKAAWDFIVDNVLAPFVDIFTKTLPDAAEAVISPLVTAFGAIAAGGEAAFGAVSNAAKATFNWVKKNWPLIAGLMGGPVGVGAALVITHWKTLSPYFGKVMAAVKSSATSAASWIESKFNAVISFFAKLPGRMTSATKGMFNGIKDAFRAAINWVIDKWNGLSFHIGGQKVFGVSLPGVTISTPNIPHLAHGGISSGGLAMVGENGPELVRLPYGSQVHSNPDTERMMGQGNGNNRIVLEINAAGNDTSKMLVEILKNAIRVRGGDVQVVLGK